MIKLSCFDFLVGPMAGLVGITGLVMRVAGGDPMTVSTGRISVIAAHPYIMSVIPFVVSGNPDCGARGALPLWIILPGRGRALISDLKNDCLGIRRNISSENCDSRDCRHHRYLNR